MKQTFLKYTFLFMLSAAMVSCDKDKDKEADAPTLDTYLKGEAQLSMFSKALDKAGLESFKNGVGPFTWFVPTNDAFTAALITEDSLNKMTPGQINYLLMYHLVNAKLSSGDMVAVNSTPRSTQLGSGNGQIYIASLNNENYINGSKVIKRDNAVSNGYVHVINRFNVPPVLKGNLQGVLRTTNNHTLFIEALTRANLWTTLGSASVFTVFAPTDEAMTAAGYTSSSIAATPVATLAAAMRYHYILNIRLFSNDLNRASIPATAAGSSSYLTTSENGTKVKGKNNIAAVSIVTPNILGTNGVVHVIDGVLKP
jgi:uncharacterized surface protein with fasciclin (FAS1) repeats